MKRRNGRRVPERFIVEPAELVHGRGRVDLDETLVVGRVIELRRLARVAPLVVAVLRKTDRVRLHRVWQRLGHQGDDQARVHPAGQKRSERHIGPKTQANRIR